VKKNLKYEKYNFVKKFFPHFTHSSNVSALVWQLMRAYTLTIVAQCAQSGELASDKEIVARVNAILKAAGKPGQIRSFQDAAIADGRIVLDMIGRFACVTDNLIFACNCNYSQFIIGEKYFLEIEKAFNLLKYSETNFFLFLADFKNTK
jgi:hypothetical protein